jgi:acetolactate synthase-1/3 small subunit
MKHTVSCIVENNPGVLASIAGSFAEKGINITSLAVGETEDVALSRMTIVVNCEEEALSEVVDHLQELEEVLRVEDLDREEFIERELMLVKVRAEGEEIAKVMQLVEIFHATVVGISKDGLVIEMTGLDTRVDALIELLRPFGIIELARTGRVAVEHHEETDQ